MATDVKSWATKFKNLTDNDETIQCMGKYYTCTFMFDMEDRKIIVEMHDGKVKNIVAGVWTAGSQTHVPWYLVGEFSRGSEA